MDWNTWNYSGNNNTLPAVNVKENDNEFLIEVAAPGMKKDDLHIDYDKGILYLSLPKREEVKPKPSKQIKIN